MAMFLPRSKFHPRKKYSRKWQCPCHDQSCAPRKKYPRKWQCSCLVLISATVPITIQMAARDKTTKLQLQDHRMAVKHCSVVEDFCR